MNIYYIEGVETSTYDLGMEMEASLISAAIVESIVSASVVTAEEKNRVPLQQEITCVEIQEQQNHKEKENTMDDQDGQGM